MRGANKIWMVQSSTDCPYFQWPEVNIPTLEDRIAEQGPDLESAASALRRLENVMADLNDGQIADLHRASSSLEPLERLLAKQRAEFDVLDFIGKSGWGEGRTLWGSEEFHSNVLAWLLNPRQPHGYRDRFLKRFLARATGRSADGLGDWSEVEVKREWENQVDGKFGYLDILIVNRAEQALCAIENKVFSSEHSEQLTRYRKALESAYPGFARSYVFLTPARTLPFREEERANWTSLGYSAVFEISQQMAESKDGPTEEAVDAFLREYAVTLRRNIMPDTSISQMARKIYLEHRKAMDLIIANRPNYITEGKAIFKEAIEEQEGWILDVEDREYVRFRSAEWDQYESTQTGIGWVPRSNALLLFQLTFYNNRPCLDLGLSTGNEVNGRLRERLFDTVRQYPKLFKPQASSLTDSWAILHKSDYILNDSDYGVGWDDGTSHAKMKAWIADFAEREFPAMNEVIVNCLREYEAERQT